MVQPAFLQSDLYIIRYLPFGLSVWLSILKYTTLKLLLLLNALLPDINAGLAVGLSFYAF